ncbi:hypothetical protein [Archangium violaceum]|uniref:hypothetical protein n=1 Tax=Archangium violaceum TaxID=83451 RepID=UPI0036DF629B
MASTLAAARSAGACGLTALGQAQASLNGLTSGGSEGYRKYFLDFITGKPLIPSQTFATREEADEWLSTGTVEIGELITIAGQGFTVSIGSKGWVLLRTRLPADPEPAGSK